MTVKTFSKGGGRTPLWKKSLPPNVNVSRVQECFWSLSPLSFGDFKAKFSKMNVCHKHHSHEILRSKTCIGSDQSSPPVSKFFFLISKKQELIVVHLENTGEYNKENTICP